MATTYDPTTADPGQIEKIPAGDVVIDPNVRTEVRVDKSFISSIRVLGFQQAPVGYRDDDGKVHITVGQRRISAALEIGWPVIPIVVKPRREAEGDRLEELRLLEQIAENEQRLSLSPAELAGGYKQLALLGVTEDQIARKTNAPKQTVQTALTVANSQVAANVLQSRPVTIDQAAIFVEFADDAAAVEQLTAVVTERPEQLEHTAARIRQDRMIADKIAAQAALLEVDGWTVQHADREWNISTPKGAAEIGSLYRTDDKKKTRLDVATAAEYSGRIAVVYPRSWGDYVGVKYFIRGYAKQGLDVANTSGSGKGPLSEEEKERRRQKRIDRAEMTAATIVRREWIETFLNSKPKPVDVNPWIAHVLLETDTGIGFNGSDSKARDLTATWLDVEAKKDQFDNGYETRRNLEKHITEKPADAARTILAYAIAAGETIAGDPKHPWFGDSPNLGPYFAALASWGYTLSDVEQRIVTSYTELAKKRKA
ncbi:ParB/RepB/Spo0J family partition protein [Microbacterium maritypicum]